MQQKQGMTAINYKQLVANGTLQVVGGDTGVLHWWYR